MVKLCLHLTDCSQNKETHRIMDPMRLYILPLYTELII